MSAKKNNHQNDSLPLEDAVKIKCCYCDLKDICTRRANKEKYEQDEWITRCTLTPNRPGSKRKKRKKRKKPVTKS